MRIFVAGATGTLGRPTVRLLGSRGHDITGLTRSPERARALEAQGIRGVVGDALDRDRLSALVAEARPDQVVHLLTALPPGGPTRKRHVAATNALRTRGTENLIHGAVKAGTKRLVAESFVAIYGRLNANHRVAEDEPLPPISPGILSDAVVALRSLESQLERVRATGKLTTVALRIGFLYGPDVPGTRDLIGQARAKRLFVPPGLTGKGPFVHVDDAAAAIVAAIEHPDPSLVYNVVDDEPASLVRFVEELAACVGAPPPRSVPRWLVKLAAPMLMELGSSTLSLSNERARRELGWSPRYPTLREGLNTLKSAMLAGHV